MTDEDFNNICPPERIRDIWYSMPIECSFEEAKSFLREVIAQGVSFSDLKIVLTELLLCAKNTS